MLLNIRIVIGHLPENWISQSRYDDLTNVTTIVIDDRRIPEGHTLETIAAHEIGHARAAWQHRERYAASTKAERDRVYNLAQDYIINEMLKPHVANRVHTDGKRIVIEEDVQAWIDWAEQSDDDEILDTTGYMTPDDHIEAKKATARALLDGKIKQYRRS